MCIFSVVLLICYLVFRKCKSDLFTNEYELRGVYKSNKIPMKHEITSDNEYKMAEEFHKVFKQNQDDRRDKLLEIYNNLGRPDTIITMFFCKKYFPLFENWYYSCKESNIEVKSRTILFTLDQEAQKLTEELGFQAYCIDPEKYKEAGNSKSFGDTNFSKTMFYKNSVMIDCLELPCKYVLFQDTDLVWFKDPIDYLKKQPEDINIMYDGPNPAFSPHHANTGFIFLKNNNRSIELIETSFRNSAYIFKIGGHQSPFNSILDYFVINNLISMKILPEFTFMNGHLFGNTQSNTTHYGDKIKKDWIQTAYVVHLSWTESIEKGKYFKYKKYKLDFSPNLLNK